MSNLLLKLWRRRVARTQDLLLLLLHAVVRMMNELRKNLVRHQVLLVELHLEIVQIQVDPILFCQFKSVNRRTISSSEMQHFLAEKWIVCIKVMK